MSAFCHIHEDLLIIPGCVLESSSRLFVDQHVIACGPVHTTFVRNERRWLLRRLKLRSELPQGNSEPQLSSWAVIIPASFAMGRSAAQLATEIAPLMNQRVIVLVVGMGEAGELWDGVVIEHQLQHELTGIQIIESQLPTARRTVTEEPEVAAEQLDDFSRLIGATSDSCVRLIRKTQVAVVGAGRNGSRVVQLLAAAGFGRIDVIDDDVIEATNLDGMDGVLQEDVGQSKARCVGRSAYRLRPEQIVVGCIERPVTAEEAIVAIRRCDIIVTAVDSDAPRLFASILAARYLRPHLDVACGVVRTPVGRRLAGDIRFLLPGDGCMHCAASGLPDESRAVRELLSSPRALQGNPTTAWHEEGDRLGSLGTLNSITCGIGVQVLIDFLSGEGELNHSFWQRFEWRSGRGLETASGRVGPGDACEICRSIR